ncbi:MAG: polyprenyl synthetase family protein [Bacillota bacterium]|nr:polyprenyl synthetase family protein [Bacillota bacterium]
MLPLFDEISADLAVVDRELHKALQSNDPLLTETANHLLKAGGKRLRPAFALLAGKFHRYDLTAVLPLAMALELIHMATLVHDDVVDAAQTRRGTPTVKALWGNRVSTHTGDFLLARALILVSEYPNEMIPRELARACVLMAEGELLQMAGTNRPDLRQYLKRIKGKTAVLIEAACKLGAVATGAPPSIYRPLGRYGYQLGMAFQITDDILDMLADERRLGKPVGGDLRQGVITLPVIYALERSPEAGTLTAIVAHPEKTPEDIREAIRITRDCGGIDFAFQVAERYLAKARAQLERLPAIPARETLARIAEFVRARSF